MATVCIHAVVGMYFWLEIGQLMQNKRSIKAYTAIDIILQQHNAQNSKQVNEFKSDLC